MRIQVDLGTVPPQTELLEPDDLKSLEVVVKQDGHAWISREELLRLAGERADDPAWRLQFDAMLTYAESQGWTGENGAIRAHIADA